MIQSTVKNQRILVVTVYQIVRNKNVMEISLYCGNLYSVILQRISLHLADTNYFVISSLAFLGQSCLDNVM